MPKSFANFMAARGFAKGNLPTVDTSGNNTVYVMADGAFICPDCANGLNGSLAALEDDTEAQWHIIGMQSNDYDTICDHCNSLVPGNEWPDDDEDRDENDADEI